LEEVVTVPASLIQRKATGVQLCHLSPDDHRSENIKRLRFHGHKEAVGSVDNNILFRYVSIITQIITGIRL
jgi:hypothetical protein